MRTLARSDHFGLKSFSFAVCFLAAAVAVCALPQSAPPSVTKVEPPSWWARHTINPVRLLVRGRNLQGARVRATRAGTKVSNVVVNQPGSYVFLDVNIHSSARPGIISIGRGDTAGCSNNSLCDWNNPRSTATLSGNHQRRCNLPDHARPFRRW